MPRFIAVLLALLLPVLTHAAGVQTRQLSDTVSVQYAAFNATELPSEVAMSVGLVRDGSMGAVQVIPLANGEPLLSSLVRGKMRSQSGDSTDLEFVRVADTVNRQDTVSFVAIFPLPDRGLVNFELRLSSPKGSFTLEFGEEVLPAKQ